MYQAILFNGRIISDFHLTLDFEMMSILIRFARIYTNAMTIRQEYCEPRAESIAAWSLDMVCESPVEGGLEDLEYEDWVI